MKPHIIHLTPPTISPEHVQEKIVCIRAHRERLFHVAYEHVAGKLLFHNYGQGGAGWTFLFGCVYESINQFEHAIKIYPSYLQKPITVLGAGCYGLLTAILLTRAGYNVTIVAQETEKLASHKAAGFFFPRPRACSTPQEIAVFHRLGLQSYKTYLSIIQGDHPFLSGGAKLLPAYYSPLIDPGFAPYIHQGLIAPPQAVIIDFGPGNRYPSAAYTTIHIDADHLMEQLQTYVQALGIPLVRHNVHAWNELTTPIIFNCTGLGAKQLTQDTRVIPVQGHLISLRAQPPAYELQYMINVKVTAHGPRGNPRDELIYYAPKRAGVIGITFLRGQDSLTANAHEFDRLIQRCQTFFGTV